MSEELIDEQTFDSMKKDLYRLIRQFSTKFKLSEHTYKIFLHDETPIEFTEYDPTEIDRFYGHVEKYCKVFTYLISNLSYESKLKDIETEQIIGSINYEKTRELQTTNTQKIVCARYIKEIFTPENILLGAIILGINGLATKFLSKIILNQENFDISHKTKMEKILDYTNFLIKDRYVSKLTNFYFQNYQSIEPLLEKIYIRMNSGRIKPKYSQLIKFIQIWKIYNKILQEEESSLETKFPKLEQFHNPEQLYEMWVFYKILSLFPGIEQQRNHREFSNKEYTIEYQYSKQIGWRIATTNKEISRAPDIIIKKNGKIIAILDAKYMRAEKLEIDETYKPARTPDRSIINQMVVYLDYGRESEKANLGIILFADNIQRERTIVKKKEEDKIIISLNLHPKNNPEIVLDYIKTCFKR